MDDTLIDIEQGPKFNVEADLEEELVYGDEGPLLVVMRAYFTPHQPEGEDWRRNNIFQ